MEFGNSVRHSASGLPGEMVTIAVQAWAGVVRVKVTDCSGPGVPQLRRPDGEVEAGRGLVLVERLAATGREETVAGIGGVVRTW